MYHYLDIIIRNTFFPGSSISEEVHNDDGRNSYPGI